MYKGMAGTKEDGKIILDQEAFGYACERCGVMATGLGDLEDMKEFKKMFVNWFYSGSFYYEIEKHEC